MTAVQRSSVIVQGRGVGAAAACAVLAANAVLCSGEPGDARGAAPVVMLGEQARHLLDGLFGPDRMAAAHRIARRIVRWDTEDAVAIAHQAVALSGADLLAALPLAGPPADPIGDFAPPCFTLCTSPPLPKPAVRRFGQRRAAAAPVTLTGTADAAAVLVEAVEAGWLFLIPLGLRHGWLLAVGGDPDALLGSSRLVAPAMTTLGAVEARFETAPRVLEHVAGDDWLALGSGALAFDPLCGDGTATAARGGILAGAVATAIAEGAAPEPLLRHYRAMLIAALRRHLAACLPFYQRGGAGAWWAEQAEATTAGHAWCTQMLAREPEPGFVLAGNRLVARAAVS